MSGPGGADVAGEKRAPLDAVTDAEHQAIAQCTDDGDCNLSEHFKDNPEDFISAAFLRSMICDRGKTQLRLTGARIVGMLEMRRYRGSEDTWLEFSGCTFTDKIDFSYSVFLGLKFSYRTELLEFAGAQMTILSDIHFVKVTVAKQINLCGAQIHGGFFCQESQVGTTNSRAEKNSGASVDEVSIKGKRDSAKSLNLESSSVSGDVFLNDTEFCNVVWLVGLKVLNSLYLNKTKISTGGGRSLHAENICVDGTLYWRDTETDGFANLSGGHCRVLDDRSGDNPSTIWPHVKQAALDGFTYERFGSEAVLDGHKRKDWLVDQVSLNPDEFSYWPHSYRQCANVLEEMGHRRDAQVVMMHSHKLGNRAYRQKLGSEIDLKSNSEDFFDRFQARVGRCLLAINSAWDPIFRLIFGYGYRPIRSLGFAMLIVAVGTVLFWQTYRYAAMVPNSAYVILSPEWQLCLDVEPENPTRCFLEGGKFKDGDVIAPVPGKDYETFNALIYAADVFVPLVDLGQDSAWAPSTSRHWLGDVSWIARWFLIIVGWLISTLGIVAASGLVKSKD